MLTRLGEVTFSVPQVRSGDFYPSALEKGTRTDQAVNLALAEMYVQGVSTRRVIDVVQRLLGREIGLSSAQVSRAAAKLDEGLKAWRERPLGEVPYLFLDARYEKVRLEGRIVDCAVLIAAGIEAGGKRRVLGCDIATSEAEIDLFGKPGVEGVGGEAEFAHGARAAVGAGEAAFAAELVAVGETLVREGVGEVEALDAGLTQGDEFAFCGLAVLRGVAPELEFGKRRVGGIEEAVAVGIQCGKRGKAVGSERAVGKRREIAEQLCAGVDGAVGVAVPDEQGVVAADPAGAGEHAVAVVVEVDVGG